MYNISIIVMASGLSRRMGQNKLLLGIHGRKVFEYVLDTVIKSKISQKIVVSQYDEIEKYCLKNNIKFVQNNMSNLGQSQSIKLGIMNSDVSLGYMFLPADMPFVTVDIIHRLCGVFMQNTSSIIVPRVDGKNTMPTIFSHKFRQDLLDISGDIGGREIINNNIDFVKYINIQEKNILIDIDTKQDYDKIKMGAYNEKI